MKPKNIKSLQSESRHLTAKWRGRSIEVQSATDPTERYTVRFSFEDDGKIRARCTCPWGQYNGLGCSHVMAALEHLAKVKGRTLSFWVNEADASRQKQRTFYLENGADDRIWITSRTA